MNKTLSDKFNTIYNSNNDRSELVNIFYNNFQSIDIIQEIESVDLIHIVINLENIRLSIYYYEELNIDLEIINIIKIIKIIHEINLFYKINYDNSYNVIIFFSNNKKYLFKKKKIITPMNINSGCTLISSYASCWRKEELEKVLIHELLHLIGIDHDLFISNVLNKKIKNIFNIDGVNHSNESYNESVAAIVNMCWKSVKYNLDIQEIYEIETSFLIFQTIKIIKFFNGIKVEDLFTIKINQTSSAISYIILKMMLFININQLLEFISDVNIKLDTSEKIKKYEELLLKIITEKKYILYLEQNFNINKSNSNFINTTMRMSVI